MKLKLQMLFPRHENFPCQMIPEKVLLTLPQTLTISLLAQNGFSYGIHVALLM